MATAWLFPGHGSQYPGMGRELLRRTPAAALLARAEQLGGRPLAAVAAAGPRRALCRPRVLEPLLAVVSMGYGMQLKAAGLRPAGVAGYSAGGLAALYCAGVLEAEAALEIALLRGRLLEAAARTWPGGMLAVYGIPGATVAGLVAELAGAGRLAVAARNAPKHTVVAGEMGLLERLQGRTLALGAHCAPLEAAGPWHGRWLEPVAERLLAALAGYRFRPPSLPLYCPVSGRIETDPERLRRHLAWQLSRPVLWQPVIETLLGLGIRRFVEVGPGRVLSGLLTLHGGVHGEFMERPDGRSRGFDARFLERLRNFDQEVEPCRQT